MIRVQTIRTLAVSLLWSSLFVSPLAAQQLERQAICAEGSEPLQFSYGTSTDGCSISQTSDLDTFAFHGAVGDVINLYVQSTFPLTALVEIRDSSFTLIDSNYCNPPYAGSCAFVMQETLARDGQYLIAVSDTTNTNTGSYLLQLDGVPPVFDSPDIPYNSGVTDSISPGTDHDYFSFLGGEGTFIRIPIISYFPVSTRVALRDPNGVSLGEQYCNPPYSGSCSFTFDTTVNPLLVSGIYTLTVSSNNLLNVGQYHISMQCLSANCPSDYYVKNLRVDADKHTIRWDPTVDVSYDVVKGSLAALRSGHGDFGGAVTQCLATGGLATTASDANVPAVNNGFFYLVRAVDSGGVAWTYESATPAQVFGRDAKIASSLNRCAP